jgi:hypothetical protein
LDFVAVLKGHGFSQPQVFEVVLKGRGFSHAESTAKPTGLQPPRECSSTTSQQHQKRWQTRNKPKTSGQTEGRVNHGKCSVSID